MRSLLLGLLLLPAAWPQDPVRLVVLEPVEKIDTNRAEISEKMPLLRPVANTGRYASWMRNESAQRALGLYRAAWEIVHPGGGTPAYYVALVPDGNHAAVGFRLQNGPVIEEYPRQPYILLDAQPERFAGTLLHETGHMAMELLAGGRRLDGNETASIPHSTAALSDRTTAFSEGYAIHLETLAAQFNHDALTRQKFHREMVMFGDAPWKSAEYFHHSVDLTSYSQSVARYLDVRENNFSFESAFQGPDYLRVQLEKARDFATVRDANQLLQSEGFYASFFYLFVMRGTEVPAESVVAEREGRILRAMYAMFGASKGDIGNPWLLNFVKSYMQQYPDEKAAIVDALNDLSHGVFVDAAAEGLWREHYLAALRLDVAKLNVQAINSARREWRERVMANPDVLFGRLGPEIACTVPALKVRLAAFGAEEPLRFDINTVQTGVLRLVPGISEEEVSGWLGQRARRPFASVKDFESRGFLKPATLRALHF